jgi:hypothetical protein
LENPATPPSLWNLFRENSLSGISRNRAGKMILGNKKPIPALQWTRMGLLFKARTD